MTVAEQEEYGAGQEKVRKRTVSEWSRIGRVWSRTGNGQEMDGE